MHMRYKRVMNMSFRDIIRREAKRQGLSGYALSKRVGPKMSMRVIQAYLAGSCDLTGGRLAAICDALGLELRPRRKRTKKA